MQNTKIKPIALGLSLGIFWGAWVLIAGLVAFYYEFGTPFVTAMGSVYMGYEASIVGSLIGGIIAFIDAFLCGAFIAWLYNVFAGCRKPCK